MFKRTGQIPAATAQRRGGIERKFLTSILWVGVVPMALALIIGYVAAYTGQKLSVQQNLATAARKTAEGVQLGLQTRIDWNARLAESEPFITYLRLHKRQGVVPEKQLEPVRNRFLRLTSAEVEYTLYDHQGHVLASNLEEGPAGENLREDWAADPKRVRFEFISDAYDSTRVATAIYDPETNEILGFLAQVRSTPGLIEFILGRRPGGSDAETGEDIYEVVDLEKGKTLVMRRKRDREASEREILAYDLDPRLAARLSATPDRAEDQADFEFKYATPDGMVPVLMAHHVLFPNSGMYVVVYRPASEVYGRVRVASIFAFLISGIMIGFFCIIAYWRVNNNIIRPVSLLNEGAQIIRQGDLELKLKIGTGDEIEELANSFNKMASALSHNISQLEDSEEKFRNLITSMRDGIFQTDTNGVITLVNPAAVQILGFGSQEEVIGLNLRELFLVQMDYARVKSELARSHFLDRTRVWMKKRDGESICVELSTNRVFDDELGFIGMEGTFRDVTQNVRLEQKARERSERIGAINQIARVINSSLEAGRVYESIVVEVKKLIDFQYAAVALQDGAEPVSGKETESNRFQGTFRTQQLWPEPAEDPSSQARIDGEDSCVAWVAREGRTLRVDNLRSGDSIFAEQFPADIVSCLCVPLHETGRIIGTLNLGFNDEAAITEHHIEVLEQMVPHLTVAIRNAKLLEDVQHSLEEVTRARENLREAIDELKTLDEMKTNLLSNVSHELRTPLVAVMGYTDMILNGKAGAINEMQKEYLSISLRNIEKLVTLIENLLDFSRLHRGDEEIFFDIFDLVDPVRTSIQIVQPVADSREISIRLDAPDAEVLVEGDKGKMGQVFNNLLSNAVKFNRSGGEVTVAIRCGEDAVEVAVSDTGIGVPEEALDKIFTRFYQYDGSSTRKYGGTGIGLSIAQDIMRLHGSRITVTSEMGAGTTFRFSLPLSVAQSTDEAAGRPALPLPTETHLLVELLTQDRSLIVQIRSLLLSEGMDVIHAAYPAVAVSLAEKYSPDCILVDTEAGPLGSVVLKEILSQPAAAHVPIVLLTDDDELFDRYRDRVSGRVSRGFRKSSLLSGIHFALSKGLPTKERLGEKILCVDDDPEVVDFIARCLAAEGYETDRCGTGEEAIERISSGDYWLVLLDIAMPGMDGWEACRQLKSDRALDGLKVYIVTAKPFDKSIRKVHECGADGYLLKPFKAEDLLNLVRRAPPHEEASRPAAMPKA